MDRGPAVLGAGETMREQRIGAGLPAGESTTPDKAWPDLFSKVTVWLCITKRPVFTWVNGVGCGHDCSFGNPAGTGGVGIVRVSGELTERIARVMLGSLPEPRTATYRRFANETA